MATKKRRSASAKKRVARVPAFVANWQPPANYKPRPDLDTYLTGISPPIDSAEFDMVVYYQWRHRDLWTRTAEQAWSDLKMTPVHAQAGIGHQIIPMEIYPQAVARAEETRSRALRRTVPKA